MASAYMIALAAAGAAVAAPAAASGLPAAQPAQPGDAAWHYIPAIGDQATQQRSVDDHLAVFFLPRGEGSVRSLVRLL